MVQSTQEASPAASVIRLGVSACLMGHKVRFDGGHKRDAYLTDTLSQWVQWIPICPEAGAGLGTPRETLRLVGSADAPRAIARRSATDHTDAIVAFADGEMARLGGLGLSGFVLKSKSPSCGLMRVKVYGDATSMPTKTGIGLFARRLTATFPLLPVEEEGRLCDPRLREAFIEQVFAYKRWQDFIAGGASRAGLVAFHAAHKYLVMAHSPIHYKELGQLVAAPQAHAAATWYSRYGALFITALRRPATVRKHCNVLQHMAGYFKTLLDTAAKAELGEVIDDFRQGLVPLIVPVTLLRHYTRLHNVTYLADQVYLQPTPKELALRNHV